MRTVLVGTLVLLSACKPEYQVTDLVGGDGEMRFNLQFTNEENVDLDLHVVTPGDFEIYYADLEDPTGGSLDVDCHCAECSEGPNENIFWPTGAEVAPGRYSVSVVYYGSCDFYDDYYYYGYDTGGEPDLSDYTLRILEGGEVIETYEGNLGPGDVDSFDYAVR